MSVRLVVDAAELDSDSQESGEFTDSDSAASFCSEASDYTDASDSDVCE